MSNSYGIQKIPNIYQCTDFRKKYWGWIKTCCATEDFTLKHIFMYKDSQSSLEYHVKKDENYYILSGKLKIGLRIGRAENKEIILKEGDIYHIPPGLMHMRIALEDTQIIEWSNKDNDSDSHIVEDGHTYTHEVKK